MFKTYFRYEVGSPQKGLRREISISCIAMVIEAGTNCKRGNFFMQKRKQTLGVSYLGSD